MKVRNLVMGVVVATVFVTAQVVNAATDVPVTVSKSFPAGKVTVDGFVGTLTITSAAPGQPVTIRATGKPDMMKRLDIRQDSNGVLIRLDVRANSVWWPWSMLDWSQTRYDDLVLTVGAPKGTEFDMDDVAGRISAGDLDAPLRFRGMGGGTAKFGAVTRARISVAGSMDVTLGNTQDSLDVEIAGSGSFVGGSAGKTRLEVAGNGSFKSGAVKGGFDGEIAGSGDAEIASVEGPVSLDIAGSGNIIIKGGRADPFKVSIAGSGDILFDGEAVNPEIDIAGSGNVTVGSMFGKLTQDIQGSGDFTVKRSAGAPPTSGPQLVAPPSPPVVPAPLPHP